LNYEAKTERKTRYFSEKEPKFILNNQYNMSEINWSDFAKVDMRVGTVTEVRDFPKARKPAYQLVVDFGELGIKKSSAQITINYSPEDLIGKQVVAVVNFPSKQIANFMSECLVLGAVDDQGVVTLLEPNLSCENGLRVA
jgi:tRNA-binding protein